MVADDDSHNSFQNDGRLDALGWIFEPMGRWGRQAIGGGVLVGLGYLNKDNQKAYNEMARLGFCRYLFWWKKAFFRYASKK